MGSGVATAHALAAEVGASAETNTMIGISADVTEEIDSRSEQIREARIKGYEGDACGECGNFTLVRNGTCLKCVTCGATSGVFLRCNASGPPTGLRPIVKPGRNMRGE